MKNLFNKFFHPDADDFALLGMLYIAVLVYSIIELVKA